MATDQSDVVWRRNNLHVRGSDIGAETIIFAHGFGTDQNAGSKQLAAVEDRFHCVVFDHAGSSASDLNAFNPRRYSSLYSYAQDLIDPSLIRVTERWVDRDAVLKHRSSPHMKLWRAAWPGLGIGERNLRHYAADIAPPD